MTSWTNLLRHLDGRQVTASESHPDWKDRNKRPFKDIGGEFYTEKRYAELLAPTTVFSRAVLASSNPMAYDSQTYEGPLLPCAPSDAVWPTLELTSDDDLREYGSTAIARCSPSNPVVDLSTLLGEFVKDGIPEFVGSTLKSWSGMSPKDRRKSISKEHLNYEFTWKPLVNDLAKLSQGIIHADSIWKQYERDAGKLVRRRYEFPEEESYTSTQIGAEGRSPYYLPSSNFLVSGTPSTGKVFRGDRTTVSRWFSGAFTYYLPSDRASTAYAVIKAKKLLGLRLTPDVIWNLMPWSWALDWFGNTGDIIQNWSNWAIDGQVLWYGYLMEHKTIERTYTFQGNTGLPGNPTVGVIRLVIETKRRIKSGPYGFGSQLASLSGRQAAIVGSLVNSRVK